MKKYLAICCIVLVLAMIITGCGKENDETQSANSAGITETTESNHDESENVESIKAEFASMQIGEYVSFGEYEQDNDETNGKEPIEWKILDKQEDRIFVISKYILASKEYNEQDEETSWEKCSLRNWLNNDFINTAFSSAEQKIIPTVTVKNSYTSYSGHEDIDTQDKIYLLGFDEIEQFFVVTENFDELCVSGTEYAKENSLREHDNGNSWWWLRSYAYDGYYAGAIRDTGDIEFGGYRASSSGAGIRPVMWITVN